MNQGHQKHFGVGFTIVELLIVVVVIAILATITIVSYNGIQQSTRESTVQSDLATAKKQLLMYKAENDTFPRSVADLAKVGLRPTQSVYHTNNPSYANYYYCANTSTDDFALVARPAGTTGNAGYVVTSLTDVKTTTNATSGIICTVIGLSGTTDANAWYTTGFSNSTGLWASWTK